MKDRIGEKFGNLTIISFDRMEVSVSKNGNKLWAYFYNCKCDCGNVCTVQTSSLTSGNTKSCGCLRKQTASKKREDLLGQTFNRLTVVDIVDSRPGSFWLCSCECGVQKEIKAMHLKSGAIKSCGCLQKEHARATSIKNSQEYRKSKGLDPNTPMQDERDILRDLFKPLAKEIYKRDSHSCVLCSKSKCLLNAHHISTWSSSPELRFEKSNIVTLCRDCHKKVHDGNYNKEPNELLKILLQGYTKVIDSYVETDGGVY